MGEFWDLEVGFTVRGGARVVTEDGSGVQEGFRIVAAGVGRVTHGVVGAEVGGGAVGADIENESEEGG